MIKRLFAAVLSLLAAAAFAAVDVNKGTQADLESIKGIGPTIATKILDERKKGAFKDWNDMVVRVKGIGENNAARFSADGLTVNGAAFSGAVDAAPKSAAKAPEASKTAKATAPAASSATMAKTKAEERAEKKAAKAEAKAAKADAKPAKASSMAPASAPSAMKTAASAPAAKK
jgi:competence protein ComEA